ncbi:hypothetical protein [Streptomyces sp. NPDC002054]|uniref:hypothetical protein n=1 Tax=Streptomyces sp. NPDC002054 TaxID=3154663 RepID=UPI0033292539
MSVAKHTDCGPDSFPSRARPHNQPGRPVSSAATAARSWSTGPTSLPALNSTPSAVVNASQVRPVRPVAASAVRRATRTSARTPHTCRPGVRASARSARTPAGGRSTTRASTPVLNSPITGRKNSSSDPGKKRGAQPPAASAA